MTKKNDNYILLKHENPIDWHRFNQWKIKLEARYNRNPQNYKTSLKQLISVKFYRLRNKNKRRDNRKWNISKSYAKHSNNPARLKELLDIIEPRYQKLYSAYKKKHPY